MIVDSFNEPEAIGAAQEYYPSEDPARPREAIWLRMAFVQGAKWKHSRCELRADNLSSLLRRIFHRARIKPNDTARYALDLEAKCQRLLTPTSPLRSVAPDDEGGK